MARPRTYDDELRMRLVEATAHAVATGGVDAMSVRGLAASVGTSTNAIYAMFGSRDGLLSAVMGEAVRSFTSAQRDVPATQDALYDLLDLGRAYRGWALENPTLYAMLFGSGLIAPGTKSANKDHLPDSSLSGMQPIIDVITRGRATGSMRAPSPIVAAVSIWAGVHGFVSLEIAQWSHSPRPQRDALYEEHLLALSSHWTAVST